jgi:hypothetical protein
LLSPRLMHIIASDEVTLIRPMVQAGLRRRSEVVRLDSEDRSFSISAQFNILLSPNPKPETSRWHCLRTPACLTTLQYDPAQRLAKQYHDDHSSHLSSLGSVGDQTSAFDHLSYMFLLFERMSPMYAHMFPSCCTCDMLMYTIFPRIPYDASLRLIFVQPPSSP